MYKGLCDRIFQIIDNTPFIVHNQLQRELGSAIAERYKLEVKYEYKIYCIPGEYHNGYIDMVFYRGVKRVMAIELDSGYKERSLKKLAAVEFPHRLWICYAKKHKPEKLERLAAYGIPLCTRFVRLNGVD